MLGSTSPCLIIDSNSYDTMLGCLPSCAYYFTARQRLSLLFLFQIEALQQIPHIVIGTPGRMVDLMKDGHLNLSEGSCRLNHSFGCMPHNVAIVFIYIYYIFGHATKQQEVTHAILLSTVF